MTQPDWLSDLDTIYVAVPNHTGSLMGKQIAATRWESVQRDGLSMPDFHLITDLTGEPAAGLQVTGYHTGFGNDLLRPDPTTLRRLPWDSTTGLVLCDPYREDGQPVPEAPRAVLAHQVERLNELGLRAQVATELEFYLFQESFQQAHHKKYRRLTPGYHRRGDNDILVTAHLNNFLASIRDAMAALGWPAETTQGEGGVGQAEINFPARAPLPAADAHTMFKHTIKTLAFGSGQAVTFLAKPSSTQPGSSCHIHISLHTNSGEPATADAASPSELNQTGQQFLAGLLAHTGELMLLHAPFANSYRRLQPHTFAPATSTWGYDNRSTMVRIVGHGESLRLEFRLPGADVNPYLSIAGMLAAGLAGITEQASPPPPVAGDAYQHAGYARLPQDLTEAVHAFHRSQVAREAFGAMAHSHLLGMAEHELNATRAAVTDWEIQRGFETA